MTESDKRLMQLARVESTRCRLHALWYQMREKAALQNPRFLLGEPPDEAFLEIKAMEAVLASIDRQVRHVRAHLKREARGGLPTLGEDDYRALFAQIQESIDSAKRRQYGIDEV